MPPLLRFAARHWEITPARVGEFRQLGLKRRYVFPHQLRYLRRPGPDGVRLARRMYGLAETARHYEVVLHASGPSELREVPRELFFCRDLIWHQQHLGLVGHVAVASVAVDGDRLYTTARFSDLVQRIARRRPYKTRVENLFRGWDHMLLNGIVHLAVELGCRAIVFPTAELAREHTDRARDPQPALFERLYDRHLQPWTPRREGRAWVVEVDAARRRLVAPEPHTVVEEMAPTICINHDIERGLGHLDEAGDFAAAATREAPAHLAAMLAIEQRLGVIATYSVVGAFLGEVRDRIEAGGHAVAFHSFDHRIERPQLARCRQADYRLPGYRAPGSVLTDDTADGALAFHNFEWLATSRKSFGFAFPRLEHGVAKLPIRTDDFKLHSGRYSYDAWEERLLGTMVDEPFFAFGLHDCYAHHWLPHYEGLLRRVRDIGALRTLDETADLLVRSRAI